MSAGYQGITGHDNIIKQLKSAVELDRVSHAYLLTGDEGSGKRTVAKAFAMALLCEAEDPSERPCLTCPSCRKALSGNHPDLITVTHEKPGSFSVDEIRGQLVNTVEILPYEGGRKVYILPEAEKMTPQAQNALLKTIEEPPEYAVILLLSSNPDALLPTVLSRCVHLSLLPLPDRLVEQYIREELQIPDYEARVIAAYAQGNIGRARKAAGDEAFSEMRDQTLSLLKGLGSTSTAALYEAVRRIKDRKEEINDVLDIMLLFYRDVLYYKASADADRLIFADEISAIRAQATTTSYPGLTDILDALDRCRVRLRANVNPELALELLMYLIKERISGK